MPAALTARVAYFLGPRDSILLARLRELAGRRCPESACARCLDSQSGIFPGAPRHDVPAPNPVVSKSILLCGDVTRGWPAQQHRLPACCKRSCACIPAWLELVMFPHPLMHTPGIVVAPARHPQLWIPGPGGTCLAALRRSERWSSTGLVSPSRSSVHLTTGAAAPLCIALVFFFG